MKSQEQIRKQLEQTYNHRLSLRITRKQKKSCRNCKYCEQKNYDLGQFGNIIRYGCLYGFSVSECQKFECRYTIQQIQKQMIQDIKDPSICGSKQPKIAALMWVLHNNPQKMSIKERIKKLLGV